MANLNTVEKFQLNFSQTAFLKSAPNLLNSPEDIGIEIAFIGRSNAGKSSAINTIVGKKTLAKTSKTPGRTQLINYFEVDPDRRLVDLPGYGFAKVPHKVKVQIEQMLSTYLSQRKCLAGLVVLMDIRLPLTPADQLLLDFAEQLSLPVHIMLTKCDKLKRGAANNVLMDVRKQLSNFSTHVTAQTFSALKGIGIEQAISQLETWFTFD